MNLSDRIERDFALHPPRTVEVAEKLDDLRTETRQLARTYIALAPVSRELELAITSLEQALSQVMAALVRNQDAPPVAQVDTLDDDLLTRIHQEV